MFVSEEFFVLFYSGIEGDFLNDLLIVESRVKLKLELAEIFSGQLQPISFLVAAELVLQDVAERDRVEVQ